MPVKVWFGAGRSAFLRPSERWGPVALTGDQALAQPGDFAVDENFYVTAKNVGAAAASHRP